MSFDAFRAEVQKRGLSVNRVALMAGITPSSLYAALNGNAQFWPGWRQRVSEVLGVPEAELFPEKEEEHRETTRGVRTWRESGQ